MRLYSSSEAFAGIAIRFHTTRDTPRASPRPARHAAPTRLTQHALGPAERLDHACAISLDNVLTIPSSRLGRTLGLLSPAQEKALARAIVLAYDLDLPLMS